MSSQAPTALSVIVIGGGIGGLAAAILLAQAGHHITVFEHRDESYQSRSTGGLCLTKNSVRWIQAMGLEQDLDRIADTGHDTMIMKYDTGKVIRSLHRTLPYSMVHRGDFLDILHKKAIDIGVDLRYGSSIASIADSSSQPTITLSDGSEFRCDLLVGSDGIESMVRRSLFPDVSPQLTPSVVMIVNVPRSIMEQTPETSKLFSTPPYHLTMAPGRDIVSWTMTSRETYHLQMCDFEYGNGELYYMEDSPTGPYVSTITDNSGLKQRWSDHEPRIRHIVNSTSSYTRWKIAIVPPLPTYSSESGRIVILGDAAHAVAPFAGQGANMALEDAKALSTLLSLISSKDEIPLATRVYDAVRIPRVAGVREIIDMNVRTFGMKGADEQKLRDKNIAVSSKKRTTHQSKVKEESRREEHATAERYKWMEEYDAEAETRQAWTQFRANEGNRAWVSKRRANL